MPQVTPTTHPIRAAATIMLGLALIGLIDNFVVNIAGPMGLWQFQLIRTAMALPLLLLFGAVTGWGGGLRMRRPGAVMARSFLNGSAMMIYFGCLAFLPVSVTAAGLFTAPVFVLLFKALFWGDRIGPWRIFAVALGFAGSLTVLNPFADGLSLIGLVPVTAGAFYALGNIATREWCEGESTLALLAGFFVVLGLFGAVGLGVLGLWPQPVPAGPDGFILRGWVAPKAPVMGWIVVQAVGSLIGVGLVIRAYQIGEAAQVSVFEYSFLIFAGFWAWVLFAQGMEAREVLGIAAIIASGVLIALRSPHGAAV